MAAANEFDPLRSFRLRRIDADQVSERDEAVIVEAAVAFVYNGSTHAVTMATPQDLEDLALGFSLGDGIVASPSEWTHIETRRQGPGITVEMRVPQQRFDALRSRSRALLVHSACGLCGSESLAAALRAPASVADVALIVRADAVHAALGALADAQRLNRASGGVHAAGFVDESGLLVREDVGRHNALDKLIGARARAGRQDGFIVMSSRASYELVHKAASAGLALLATISAPSSAAIELAERCGLSLIAFARDQRMNVYTHPWRVR